MTGYESISLAAQHVVFWVAAGSLAVVVIAAVGIWRGIAEMERDNREHARRHRDAMAKEDQRHKKAMAALRRTPAPAE